MIAAWSLSGGQANPAMLVELALVIGFALIGYGLSPLAGTTIAGGVSERGCLAALAGIGIACATTVAVVAF